MVVKFWFTWKNKIEGTRKGQVSVKKISVVKFPVKNFRQRQLSFLGDLGWEEIILGNAALAEKKILFHPKISWLQ